MTDLEKIQLLRNQYDNHYIDKYDDEDEYDPDEEADYYAEMDKEERLYD